MTKSIMFVMIAAILVSGTGILSEIISEASAIKSKGNTMLKVGSAGSPVCGDHLCTVEELKAKQSKTKLVPASSAQTTPTPQIVEQEPLYNETLNPRQIEYPAHLGFNDLHIGAINHLIPSDDDSVLDMLVHHHCKVYDDMTAACLLFPTGMGDQDKPYGMEYVIGADAYAGLA